MSQGFSNITKTYSSVYIVLCKKNIFSQRQFKTLKIKNRERGEVILI